ncbi:MAG: FHA domain-containing protein [Planctomycetaceae bacterium]
MLQVHLRVVGGKHDGKRIAMTGNKFLIGREQDCHLRPNSELVSRHHCVLSVDDFSVRLRDLGSTNGTFINGERLRGQTQLKSGDQIVVGKLELEVQIDSVSAVEVASPAAPVAPEVEPETVSMESSETAFELPVPVEAAGVPPAQPVSPGDTTIISPGQMPYGQPMPAYPVQQMPGYPPVMMPGQVPQGYPQMPVMYPAQPMPVYPQQLDPGAVVPEPDSGSGVAPPPVKLPPPEATGFSEAPAEPPAEGGEAQAETPVKPSNSAADIIRQYMQRRPAE